MKKDKKKVFASNEHPIHEKNKHRISHTLCIVNTPNGLKFGVSHE